MCGLSVTFINHLLKILISGLLLMKNHSCMFLHWITCFYYEELVVLGHLIFFFSFFLPGLALRFLCVQHPFVVFRNFSICSEMTFAIFPIISITTNNKRNESFRKQSDKIPNLVRKLYLALNSSGWCVGVRDNTLKLFIADISSNNLFFEFVFYLYGTFCFC